MGIPGTAWVAWRKVAPVVPDKGFRWGTAVASPQRHVAATDTSYTTGLVPDSPGWDLGRSAQAVAVAAGAAVS